MANNQVQTGVQALLEAIEQLEKEKAEEIKAARSASANGLSSMLQLTLPEHQDAVRAIFEMMLNGSLERTATSYDQKKKHMEVCLRIARSRSQ